jgi:hypothetical protein
MVHHADDDGCQDFHCVSIILSGFEFVQIIREEQLHDGAHARKVPELFYSLAI